MDPRQSPWAVTGESSVVKIFIRSTTSAINSQGIPKNEELHPNDQPEQQGDFKITIRGAKIDTDKETNRHGRHRGEIRESWDQL